MRNHCCENDFDLHENETACRTDFHMKGFALRLVLKQRHKRTRKWPIGYIEVDFSFALPDFVLYIEEFDISRFAIYWAVYSIHFTITFAGTGNI